MATWKETSVLGEQCDGVGCFGWGVVVGAEDKEGREGSGGTRRAHPGSRGIASLATATTTPLELGSIVLICGGLEQSGLLSHNEQSI